MGRRPLWKDFYIQSGDDFGWLQAYAQNNSGAWRNYTIVFHDGIGSIETNLPYSELWRWFRYALDKPVPDHVTCDRPTWELYTEEEIAQD